MAAPPEKSKAGPDPYDLGTYWERLGKRSEPRRIKASNVKKGAAKRVAKRLKNTEEAVVSFGPATPRPCTMCGMSTTIMSGGHHEGLPLCRICLLAPVDR